MAPMITAGSTTSMLPAYLGEPREKRRNVITTRRVGHTRLDLAKRLSLKGAQMADENSFERGLSRRRFVLSAAGAGASLWLAGCGGTSSEDATGGGGSETPTGDGGKTYTGPNV